MSCDYGFSVVTGAVMEEFGEVTNVDYIASLNARFIEDNTLPQNSNLRTVRSREGGPVSQTSKWQESHRMPAFPERYVHRHRERARKENLARSNRLHTVHRTQKGAKGTPKMAYLL